MFSALESVNGRSTVPRAPPTATIAAYASFGSTKPDPAFSASSAVPAGCANARDSCIDFESGLPSASRSRAIDAPHVLVERTLLALVAVDLRGRRAMTTRLPKGVRKSSTSRSLDVRDERGRVARRSAGLLWRPRDGNNVALAYQLVQDGWRRDKSTTRLKSQRSLRWATPWIDAVERSSRA